VPLAATIVAPLDGPVIMHVRGELDIATVPLLLEAFRCARGPVTIDASELSFIDARGLGALVAANNRIGVSVRHARPACRRVFEVCGLETLLAD
jgi:anti-anti-sigma factor